MRLRSGRRSGKNHAQVSADTSTTRKAFEFFRLPAEVRQLVYHAVFAQRSIVFHNALAPGWPPRYEATVSNATDSTVALLQTCKQICIEACALVELYFPADLVLVQDIAIYQFIQYHHFQRHRLRAGFLTLFTLHATAVRNEVSASSICPARKEGYRYPKYPAITSQPPGYTNYSQQNNILDVSLFDDDFRNRFPAWKVLQIYNTLGEKLGTNEDTCRCSIANTKSCSCGRCKCRCPQLPDLSVARHMSSLQVEAHLYDTILPRYREVMPQEGLFRSWSLRDQDAAITAVLNLLACGITIVFHDEISLNSVIDAKQIVHKGKWRTSYRLKPPQDASKPRIPSHDWVPALKEESTMRETTTHRPANLPSETPGGDRSRSKSLREYRDFMTIPRERPERGHLQQLLDEADLAKAAGQDKVSLPPLTDFEAEMTVKLMNEDDFDDVFAIDSKQHQNFEHKLKQSKLWQWG